MWNAAASATIRKKEIEAERRVLKCFYETLEQHVSETNDPETGELRTISTYWLEADRVLQKFSEGTDGADSAGDRTVVVQLEDIPEWAARFTVRYYERLLDRLQTEVTRFVHVVDSHRTGSASPNVVGKLFYLKLEGDFCKEEIKTYNIRDIRCENIGRLIRVRGQVTRTSDVLPELVEGTFSCKLCGATIEAVKQQHKFTQPLRCSNDRCIGRYEFELLPEESRFGDFQKWRIQEPAQEAGAGAIPRSLEIIARCDQADNVNPGDDVLISGCLVVVPIMAALLKRGEVSKKLLRQIKPGDSNTITRGITGMKFIGVREIQHRVCFMVNGVQKLTGVESVEQLDATADEDTPFQPSDVFWTFPWVQDIAKRTDTLDVLTKLIAPRVYGADEIKKGILLMLAGGVQKHGPASKLRGDINICIVGDPSTGKSQLLKFVESFSKRAIFTSGKGSTAAGLTAAVHRDPETGETVLEAGALMYADHGVCCIDEFDKMNEKDRVSIHEAMEQQTISISKAGVQATLNARACILAGCNPRFGRYDHSKTFSQNVNIPSPLLSRFDLFFTTSDQWDEAKDTAVATHIVGMANDHDDEDDVQEQPPSLISNEELKVYVELARHTKPILTTEAKQMLINFYVGLRTDEMLANQRSMRITVRQLEALVRLSEAVAKLKFSSDVLPEHVSVACSVFRASLKKVTNVVPEVPKPPPAASGADSSQGATQAQADGQTPNDNQQQETLFGDLDVNYDTFKRIRDRLIYKVKEYEEENQSLIRDSDVAQWYVLGNNTGGLLLACKQQQVA
eukprot:GHVQ01040006.1.p1 GENE.GHVQ01040006.1~~GHVQ01040006.1.p1  ORF type:complete len:794 (+),score=91.68 GHVQ01040006.1:578-2959(+)